MNHSAFVFSNEVIDGLCFVCVDATDGRCILRSRRTGIKEVDAMIKYAIMTKRNQPIWTLSIAFKVDKQP
jgi:hypothetical protein